MKIKKSYIELQIIDAIAADYLIKGGWLKETKYTDKLRTKFAESAINILNQINLHIQYLNNELDNLKIKNCAVDPVTKIQLKSPEGKRQYTIEGELQLKLDIQALMKQEVELNSRIVLAADLDFKPTIDEIEILKGVLLE